MGCGVRGTRVMNATRSRKLILLITYVGKFKTKMVCVCVCILLYMGIKRPLTVFIHVGTLAQICLKARNYSILFECTSALLLFCEWVLYSQVQQ